MNNSENTTSCQFPFDNTNATVNCMQGGTDSFELFVQYMKPQIVIYPILIVFGTIGNILIFLVMRRGSLKESSTCLYLSVLAIADTG